MGSATAEGARWGARAIDWAEIQQPTIRPVCLDVLTEFGPWSERSVLDIGCGAGEFANLATALGAMVSGLDAAAALVEIARERTPSATFAVGDMEDLPFPDAAFAVVTAFNCLHFANDPAAAVAEALRVTQPDGCLVVATWGPPAECDAITYLLDLGALMPEAEPPALDSSDPDALRALLATTTATLSGWRVVPCPWQYADLDTALRGLLSTGPAAQAIEHSGIVRVVDTISASIAPYRRRDGSYRLDNTCYYLVADV